MIDLLKARNIDSAAARAATWDQEEVDLFLASLGNVAQGRLLDAVARFQMKEWTPLDYRADDAVGAIELRPGNWAASPWPAAPEVEA